MFQKFASLFLALAVIFSLTACVQQPTPFEEPERPTFPEAPTVSIRDPEEGNLPNEESTSATELQEEERIFILRIPSGEPCMMTKVFYGEDGIVTHIYGEVFFEDKSIGDIEALKNDVEITKDLVEKFDLSGMNISVDEDETTYFEVYHFLFLDQVPENADLAAAFIGFKAENGKITIEKAAEAMIGFGFTEE